MYEDLVTRLRNESACDEYENYVATMLEQAADAIEELQQMAEHYKGCSEDWYREACEYKQKLEKAKEKWEDLIYLADQANKVIESGGNPSWIPVNERLPEPRFAREWYLVSLESGCVMTLSFERDEKRWATTGTPVTHWMPLPEPPEEGGGEDA